MPCPCPALPSPAMPSPAMPSPVLCYNLPCSAHHAAYACRLPCKGVPRVDAARRCMLVQPCWEWQADDAVGQLGPNPMLDVPGSLLCSHNHADAHLPASNHGHGGSCNYDSCGTTHVYLLCTWRACLRRFLRSAARNLASVVPSRCACRRSCSRRCVAVLIPLWVASPPLH